MKVIPLEWLIYKNKVFELIVIIQNIETIEQIYSNTLLFLKVGGFEINDLIEGGNTNFKIWKKWLKCAIGNLWVRLHLKLDIFLEYQPHLHHNLYQNFCCNMFSWQFFSSRMFQLFVSYSLILVDPCHLWTGLIKYCVITFIIICLLMSQ